MIKNKLIFGIVLTILLFSFGSIVSGSLTVPELSNEYPTDGSINIDVLLQSTVNVTIYDLEEKFNWTIQGDFLTNSFANLASNGSKSANIITPLDYSTVYTWYVNVTDNITGEYGNWTNATYSFTTRAEARLTEHFTDTSKILLIGLVSILLLLGLIVYAIKTMKEKTFEIKTFITMFIAVVVITVILSFL